MGFERKDRVQDYTSTTGTGTVNLSELTDDGYRTFASAFSSGAIIRYLIISADKTEWEVGEGVYTNAATDTLSRDTVYASSNSGNKVNFSTGTKKVHAVVTAKDFSQGRDLNDFMNGDCLVWQKSVFSWTNPANATFPMDRLRIARSDDANVDILRSTDVPTALEAGRQAKISVQADVTLADASIGAGQYYALQHNAEGIHVAKYGFGKSGERYATLSFWVKATKTGTYCVAFRNNAYNRSYIAEYTINASDTWEEKVVTIPIATDGTWETGSLAGLSIFFIIACGSTFHTTADSWANGNYLATSNQVNGLDSASNNFRICMMQLVRGSEHLPFMSREFEEERVRCMRYYEKSANYEQVPTSFSNGALHLGLCAAGAIPNGNRWPLGQHPKFKVEKRTTPTITIYGSSMNTGQWNVPGIGNTNSSVSAFRTGFWIINNSGASKTLSTGDAYGSYEANSEL